jgi:aerobic C4-dicarboxylate transport protein
MNIHLPLEQQLGLLAVAMLSSKGAAGVTGAGFIALAATLESVTGPDGKAMIPVAGMVIILGVDRFLSECRALTNFIGNAVATIVVSRWEGVLDHDKLRAAMQGKPSPAAATPIEQDTD